MYDERLLKQRIRDTLVSAGVEQLEKFETTLVDMFNEHSKAAAILNNQEKDRIRRLEKMIDFKTKKLEERDPENEAQKQRDLGERYNDYLSGEISALEWAVKFIKEHSI